MNRVRAYKRKVRSNSELRQDWTAYKVVAIFLLAGIIGAAILAAPPIAMIQRLSRAIQIEGK